MNKAGIRYLVLRNYLPVSNLNLENDIDIFIHPDDRRKTAKLLLENDWLQRFIPRPDRGHWGMFKVSDSRQRVYMLDIQSHLFSGIDIEVILKRRQLEAGCLFVPHAAHGLVLYLLRLVLEKNNIDKKNIVQIKLLWERCGPVDNFLEVVRTDFGDLMYHELLKITKDDSLIFRPEYYVNLAKSLGKTYGRYQSGNNARRLWQKFKIRLCQYRNLFLPLKLIAFVGVDGAGKTTLINKLKAVSPVFKNQVYFGWKDYYFEFIGRLDNKVNFSNRLLRNFLNRGRFFLFHLFLPFDFWARYLRAKKQAKYGIIIADRYPLPKELPAQGGFIPWQKIYRRLSLGLIYFLLPRPDIMFVLSGDPKVLWSRKKEGDYNKFLAEFKRCNRARDRFPDRTVAVDTDISIADSFNKIYQAIRCLLR